MRRGPDSPTILLLWAASALLPGAWWPAALAQEADLVQDNDRAMRFVERSVEATELFNQGRHAESLAVFDELLRYYSDLDEDGYVAMSYADCLSAMGRYEEARVMYESIPPSHPALAETVRGRLREMALAGDPDQMLIQELREAVRLAGQEGYSVKVQLGRALQKRAALLLDEASTAFRAAAETTPTLAQPTRRIVAGQAEMLAEIREDLSSLIDRVEKAWAAVKRLTETGNCGGESSDAEVRQYRAEWVTSSSPQQVKLETTGDDGTVIQAIINGKSVPLSRTQSLIIRRPQERINAILFEAIQADPAGPSETG